MAPLDLHVLGTPPAFVLSQDQTLEKIFEELLAQSYFTLISCEIRVFEITSKGYSQL